CISAEAARAISADLRREIKMKKGKFTSLRTKTILVLLCLLVFLVSGTALILHSVMIERILTLEKRNIAEHLSRAQNTISEKTENLAITAYDWATWDETYKFIADKNAKYIEDNLMPDTFSNLNLNAMVFMDTAGDVVYSGGMDQVSQTVTPVSSALIDYLKQSPIAKNIDAGFSIKGIIDLPEGPMIIAAYPILNSFAEGPVRGNYIIGFYLDQNFVDSLAQQLNLKLSLEPINIAAKQNTVLPTTVKFNIISSQLIEATTNINDVDKKATVALKVEMNRDIYAIGKKGIDDVALYIGVFCIMVVIILLLYINRSILSKLSYISGEVRDIGEKRLFTKRLNLQKTNDEFMIVSHEINGMLDELQKAEEEVKYQANHDALTGLANRRLLSELMQHAIHHAGRYNKNMAVMFLDIDAFKTINDTMGHDFGDKILKEVSNRLLKSLRKSDILARIGGDEFIIVIENVEELNRVKTVAENILREFHNVIHIDEQDYKLTTSIGIAIYPNDGQTAGTLLKNADIALYRSKDEGKDRYSFFSDELDKGLEPSAN
ncbi:MAG: diguanylate cyclase, partial [Erysipelotrichaceae bacterium]